MRRLVALSLLQQQSASTGSGRVTWACRPESSYYEEASSSEELAESDLNELVFSVQ